MDVERLRRVVDAIAQHPQALNMELWHCGTEACFAGHAVDVMAKEQGLTVQIIRQSPTAFSSVCQVGDGPRRLWSDVACEYLDLTEKEADVLFDPTEWPDVFNGAYYDAQDMDDRVGMVAALRGRVEHFIAHEGVVR